MLGIIFFIKITLAYSQILIPKYYFYLKILKNITMIQQYQRNTIWSDLSKQFQDFQTILINELTNNQCSNVFNEEKQRSNSSIQLQQSIKHSCQNFQIQIKKKLSNILFQLNINEAQLIQKKKQVQYLHDNNNKTILQNQIQIQKLQSKIKNSEILIQTYEKSLINRMSLQNLCKISQKNQNILKHFQQKSISLSNKNKPCLQLFQAYNVNFKGQNANPSLVKGDLSFSRMTSSRLSMHDQMPRKQALKQLEQNWNKSINLSNRSAKLLQKSNIKSSLKEDKQCGRTNFREQKLNRSSLLGQDKNTKYTKTSKKQNIEHQRSQVSQFIIDKK